MSDFQAPPNVQRESKDLQVSGNKEILYQIYNEEPHRKVRDTRQYSYRKSIPFIISVMMLRPGVLCQSEIHPYGLTRHS